MISPLWRLVSRTLVEATRGALASLLLLSLCLAGSAQDNFSPDSKLREQLTSGQAVAVPLNFGNMAAQSNASLYVDFGFKDQATDPSKKNTVSLLDMNGDVLLSRDIASTQQPKAADLGVLPRDSSAGILLFSPDQGKFVSQLAYLGATTARNISIIGNVIVQPDDAGSEFTIKYTLNMDCEVTCRAYPVDLEKPVWQADQGTRAQGDTHTVRWHPEDVKPGSYVIEVRATNINDKNQLAYKAVIRKIKKPSSKHG